MLDRITDDKREVFWLIMHVLFALASLGSKFMVITYFYFVMATVTFQMLSSTKNNVFPIYLKSLAYIMGFEMWSRLVYAPPFIPVEIGKYYPIYFGIIVLLKQGGASKNKLGLLILLLTLPSVIAYFPTDPRHVIPFQYLGIFNLGLFLLFFYNKRLNLREFQKLAKLMVFPLTTVLIFTIMRAPDFSEFDQFGGYIGRNDIFSGGAAPNQVSTYFGVGFLILFLFFLMGKTVFKTAYVDKVLMLLFLFQGFMTFSRGGVMTALLAAIAFYYFLNFSGSQKFSFKPIKFNPIGIALIVLIPIAVFFLVDNLTKGSLSLRYKGQSNSVASGARELDADYYTSGRLGIAEEEWLIFLANPSLGAGLQKQNLYTQGASKEDFHMTHSEWSRLPAEHGILGLIAAIILLVFPIFRLRQLSHPVSRSFMVAFWIVSAATMFHAAMRTVVPPFFFGLAALVIVDNPIVTKRQSS